MEIVIVGQNLPGRWFRNVGVPIHNVHVGVQIRRDPVDLVPADSTRAEWRLDVRVDLPTGDEGVPDFGGPAVHGRQGERFLYLTWGDLGDDGTFAMFRRAKLMLDRIPPDMVRAAVADGSALHAAIDLTDGYGGPRCGRVNPPALKWSIARRPT